MRCSIVIFYFVFALNLQAQQSNILKDSLDEQNLSAITVVGAKSRQDIQQIPEIVGTNIYCGKKSALVVVENVMGNTSNNTMRQVMAKVPGIHVWESDGSGIQIGIASRGLSPNRSWEFNIRQNGYDIAADPYGYPEAYYNPQLQSVQRIEIVRGHGALQYGAQIGGMVNYILKNGSDYTKRLQVEVDQTFGSFGLDNTFIAAGGKTKKWNYYSYFDHRNSRGWRENSKYKNSSGFFTATYHSSPQLSFTLELMRWNMQSQQAGGLTDLQFDSNPRKSFRSRNWLDITWSTAAAIMQYNITANSLLNIKVFGLAGDRNSVGFMPAGGITVADTINSLTGKYNARTVDDDQYRNMGLEARFLYNYNIADLENALSIGLRAYSGNTYRYKGGMGTEGLNYDNSVDGKWQADIDYSSKNAALFAENIFRINENFSVVPGFRIEYLKGVAGGYGSLKDGNPVYLQHEQRSRTFLIAALGAEYRLGLAGKIYANVSQSYRPIQFADLTAPPTTDVIDATVKDAKGLNIDLGFKAKKDDYFFFDASMFYLGYNNRIGTIKQQRMDGSFYNFRTNVGKSVSKGIETIVEWNPVKNFTNNSKKGDASLFVSYSYTDARYADLKVINLENNALVERNFKHNRVENAPRHILRSGINYHYRWMRFAIQHSYTAEMFTDANNTILATKNGQNGLIPAYSVVDFSFAGQFTNYLCVKFGINNLGNQYYFTRRAGGYPGPGLLPAEGRSFWMSILTKF